MLMLCQSDNRKNRLGQQHAAKGRPDNLKDAMLQ